MEVFHSRYRCLSTCSKPAIWFNPSWISNICFAGEIHLHSFLKRNCHVECERAQTVSIFKEGTFNGKSSANSGKYILELTFFNENYAQSQRNESNMQLLWRKTIKMQLEGHWRRNRGEGYFRGTLRICSKRLKNLRLNQKLRVSFQDVPLQIQLVWYKYAKSDNDNKKGSVQLIIWSVICVFITISSFVVNCLFNVF